MKILIVCSGNYEKMSPFVKEQAEALESKGAIIDYFQIKGKGLLGYLSNLSFFKEKITEFSPDIVHAHYGLSGLLACLQRKVPVFITFHGSDINKLKPRIFSWFASRLSKVNIFVSASLLKTLNLKVNNRNVIIPCGVNCELFQLVPQKIARERLGLDIYTKYVLFTSCFDNHVKNYQLCYETISKVKSDIEIIELKNYDRKHVQLLMYACDLLLMTSYSEGSPQVVKEAIAAGLPVVSVDVGDVMEIRERTLYEDLNIVEKTKLAESVENILAGDRSSKNAGNIQDYENDCIADKLLILYKSVLRDQ